MDIDLYTPCPCGSGKKIKFCCSKDIVTDLSKLLHKIGGEQRLAALELADALLQKHGERAALLALKSTVLMQLGEHAAAAENVNKFVELNPGNSVALAQSAIVELANNRLDVANERLQRALAVVGEQMPMAVFDAAMAMVEAHLMHGKILPARGYLILLSNIGGVEREPIIEQLMRVDSSATVSLFLKQHFHYSPAPADASWSADFNAALEFARRGAWKVGLDSFKPLLAQAADSAPLHRNIAILQGWLGDADAAAASWRDYAKIESVEEVDAIEAEALALLLAAPAEETKLPQVLLTFPVQDVEGLLEKLSANACVENMKLSPATLGQIDQPPPKSGFILLSKETPKSGVDLTRDQAPLILGELFVFGRETDREARVTFGLIRDDHFDEKVAAFKEIVGDLCQDASEEKESGEVGLVGEALAWRCQFPEDTPAERREQLIQEHQQIAVLDVWPNLKRGALNGLSAREAASSGELKKRVAGAVLLLELSGQQSNWNVDCNKLRESLGIASLSLIDPTAVDTKQIPLPRLHRLDVEKMSVEQLTNAYYRAGISGYLAAIRSLGRELVKRDDAGVDGANICATLARVMQDPLESLDLIRQAQTITAGKGESPAQYMLAELQLRLQTGVDPENTQNVFEQIRAKHLNEPGIGQALYELLASSGIINPEGAPTEPEPAAEAGKLWTPDSAQASGSGKESKLWVPGSD